MQQKPNSLKGGPTTPREYYEKHVEGWKHIPWEELNKDAKDFWTQRYNQYKNA